MKRGGELVVVDYGVNNVGSVVNMLRRLDAAPVVARDAAGLANASALLLPGIGSFDTGVENLQRVGLVDAIRERVDGASVPILGICLGMQLLTRGSEEGARPGLGLVPAVTKRFALTGTAPRVKVPHMGWNVTACRDPELFDGLLEGPTSARFYYVHSYHVVCDDDGDVAASCVHGVRFTAALRRKHILGTQFHPEKSHRFGMTVLRNFLRMTGHG